MSSVSCGRSLVEDVDKLVEAGLLLKEVGRGGLGGFFFNVRCKRS
jgi:hypothetical protein